MNDRDAAFDYLSQAEDTLIHYGSVGPLVTDEAYLLRGCLAALTSIARQMYDQTPDGS